MYYIYSLPNHVWHITHRCHKKEFLLKFAKDRQRWRHWLFEAKKRYGLRVLNYIITSNHIHMLVYDRGLGEVAKSMQLIAGRTAQAYNKRKARQGAFWEDRYHVTLVDSEIYLARCMVYVDLNMVRAGVVSYPDEWEWCGYSEIQSPPKRYSVIDKKTVVELFGVSDFKTFQRVHRGWVEDSLSTNTTKRDLAWTQAIAVGRKDYVEGVQVALGIEGKYRVVTEEDGEGAYSLREPDTPYSALLECEKSALSDV